MLLFGINDCVPTVSHMLHKRRYRTKKYHAPSPKILACGAFALLVPFAVLLWLHGQPEPARDAAPLAAALPAALPMATANAPAQLVYRLSVIPGGVRSATELAATVRRDQVVAAHYAGFDVAAAHLVRLDKPRFVHVSYRIGDKVYWTRKKVQLAAGEYLLSDGRHLARTRCGNRIADEVQAPVLADEPAPQVLEQSFASADGLVDLTASVADAAFTQPATAARAPEPPVVRTVAAPRLPQDWNPPIPSGPMTPPPRYHAVVASDPRPQGKTPVPPPAPVPVKADQPTPIPEPGSVPLVGVALAALALARRAARRARRG